MITKRPPSGIRSSSTRKVAANPAIAPPNAKDPVSPIKIFAGAVFHHRKPVQPPANAAARTAKSKGSRTA